MGDLDLPWVQAAEYGPKFTLPAHIRVIHSTEGPMVAGNARALASNWFGRRSADGGAGTSAHDIFDPAGGILMVPADHIAWHCGPGGNGFTRGSEHCGYVALPREQWLSPAGQAMLDHSARFNAAAAHRDGVLPRWLTIPQLRAHEPGFCTHNDIRLAFGGTTHSDPGPNFPYDWYMQRVQFYYDGGTDEIEGIIMASGDDIVGAVNGVRDAVNRQMSGFYETMVRPDTAHEPGSVRGTNNRLDEVTEQLADAVTALQGISGKLDAIVTKLGG